MSDSIVTAKENFTTIISRACYNFKPRRTHSLAENNINRCNSKIKGCDNLSPNEEFEILWENYPNKENPYRSKKVFLQLKRKKELPSLDILIQNIKNNITHNDKWARGYSPQLCNFLRDRRYEEAIIGLNNANQEQAKPKFLGKQIEFFTKNPLALQQMLRQANYA